eukprot:GHVP01015436.1.p1 GENE.GHVP01015436.1~~GHVP01015436.1.p1  ORF type:complete len:334 (+),score=56.28 GHVP01015436.1:67-1068(+)
MSESCFSKPLNPSLDFVSAKKTRAATQKSELKKKKGSEIQCLYSNGKKPLKKTNLSLDFTTKFAEWEERIRAGWNLLVFGYGTKTEYLRRFVDSNLRDHYVLLLDGRNMNLSFQRAMWELAKIMGANPTESDTIKTLIPKISECQNSLEIKQIVILALNLEGEELKDHLNDIDRILQPQVPTAKCIVRLIATIDDYWGMFLIDENLAWRMRLLVEPAFHTWEEYKVLEYLGKQETPAFMDDTTSDKNIGKVDISVKLAQEKIAKILQSVTEDSKEVFKMLKTLAKHGDGKRITNSPKFIFDDFIKDPEMLRRIPVSSSCKKDRETYSDSISSG